MGYRRLLPLLGLLLCCAANSYADGAPAFAAASDGAVTGGTSPTAVSFGGTVGTGSVALTSIFISSPTVTVTAVTLGISCSSQAMTVTPGSPKVSTNFTHYWFTAQVASGGCTTVNITLSGTATFVSVQYDYIGLATSSPIDCEASATGSGTALNSGTCATANAHTTLLAAGYVGTGSLTFTAGGGFSIVFQSSGGSTSRSGEALNETSTGTYGATITASSSGGEWIEHMLALKSAIQGAASTIRGPSKIAGPTKSD